MVRFFKDTSLCKCCTCKESREVLKEVNVIPVSRREGQGGSESDVKGLFTLGDNLTK